MPTDPLSLEAQGLLQDYKKALDKEKNYNASEEEKIAVHQVSSKLAFFYEKLRNTVDYKEEHLLRKNAIARILKRRIMTEKTEHDVAKSLMYELIRARYLPNKRIPEKRIEDVKTIIEKYTFLLNNLPAEERGGEGDKSLFDWMMGIAACEIEEMLVPRGQEDAIVDFARRILEKRIKTREELRISPSLRSELIYAAVLKSLTKSDLDMIRYKLFIMKHSDWLFAPSETKFTRMALIMRAVTVDIDRIIDNEFSDPFNKAVRKNVAYFNILQEVAAAHPKEVEHIFSHHYHVEDSIKETCIRKYRLARTKLKRAAVRSIIYIFITKVFLALLIEVPYDKFVAGAINYGALMINIFLPPILMALVVMTIKVPSKKNTVLIVAGIKDMLYDEEMPSIPIKGAIPRRLMFSTAFRLLYLIVFGISFGFIFWVLNKLGFNIVSMIIFIFFLSVVSYFSIRIRQNANELLVVQRKEGTLSFLIDLFFMPIVQVGQYLSVKMSSLNVFVYALDFIIEAPFKTFVEIFEEWIYYVKEEEEKLG